MKKKLLVAIMAIVTAICCVFAFGACEDGDKSSGGGSGTPAQVTEAQWQAAFDYLNNANYIQTSYDDPIEADVKYFVAFDKVNKVVHMEDNLTEGEQLQDNYFSVVQNSNDNKYYIELYDVGHQNDKPTSHIMETTDRETHEHKPLAFDTETQALAGLMTYTDVMSALFFKYGTTETEINSDLRDLYSAAVYDSEAETYTLSLYSDSHGTPVQVVLTLSFANGHVEKCNEMMSFGEEVGEEYEFTVAYETVAVEVPEHAITWDI